MSITEQIQEDMKTAMKAGDWKQVAALRMLISQLLLSRKEATSGFGEKEEIEVLAAEKKRRVQAAEGFREGGREESARNEEEEAELISAYLPEALGDEELAAIIDEVVSSTGAAGMKDMGRVMSEVMTRVAGRADGRMVSDRVKEVLSG